MTLARLIIFFFFFLDFVICLQAHHILKPKRVRYPTDWCFTFRCSPHHLAVTQLLLVTGLVIDPGIDFHYADQCASRAHKQGPLGP